MEQPALKTLTVPRTARYAILGHPNASEWWIVLHGYGQLAANFIEAFTPVATDDRCIVAPEGLSRFYVDAIDEHKQVGASWMTQEAREDEIGDYVRALDAVVRDVGDEGPPASLVVLGFSQGAATASRWALLGETSVDRLVLWSGAPAHDLDLDAHAEEMRTMDVTLVVGDNDPHVTQAQRKGVVERLQSHEIPLTVHTFDGGHRLDRRTLQTLVPS